MEPLAILYEKPGLPAFGIPETLALAYGGDLGIATPRVYANFVASVDSVVTLAASGESGRIISGGSEADRFVMALLRACADAVLIGAGTFRADRGHLWRAEALLPDQAPLFTELRQRLGLRTHPPLVVVTRSGDIDPEQPALDDATVITTLAGESRLRGKLPSGTRLLSLGESPFNMSGVIALLRAEGFARLLTEGGPTLVGELVAARLLDELFLTSSPVLFGRHANDGRKSLIDGSDAAGAQLELASVRRHGSHLFLRYVRS